MTGTNVFVALLGFATGPFLARALGPADRGVLAAIVVPLTIAPWVVGLGLPAYATREAARGQALGLLVGSLGAASVAIGLLALGPAVPTAAFLSQGKDVVQHYLLIGFALLPLTLLANLFFALLNGAQRWRALVAARVAPFLVTAVAISVLYVLGDLTVSSAALTTIVGMTLPILPAVVSFGLMRVRISLRCITDGLRFGLRSWIGTLGSLTKYRLDQLMMIPLTSSRQLGLYVVAVTISGAADVVTTAVSQVASPRVSQGDRVLAARGMRVLLFMVTLAAGVIAVVVPWLLPALFGSLFSDAIGMTWILLAASIPGQGSFALSSMLTAAGRPGLVTVGELFALSVTVPGLLLLLPPLGGIGAALVSLVAYSVAFIYLLVAARRHFRLPISAFVIVRGSDFAWARAAASPGRAR
jgi:O-antigen/teichoic acid export membrane protein